MMKRGFLGYSKKKPADSLTIQPINRQNTVHLGTIHRGTVHPNTVYIPSIDTVHLPSIDTVHLASIDTVHHASTGTVHPNTIHPDTVHPVKNDTTCLETEKIEVLILKIDENGMLRDEKDRTRSTT
ncbi:hypothetical protein F2Q68_00033592 [Brassica cretica]|uniref:Uncharacterized protein n=1 Tax=Brassica cretica TaxID=69181 RepID=A0A8S9H7T0_BRACR|nr:hypothetical protein F2Q68_00033592 [Brassica cretica]